MTRAQLLDNDDLKRVSLIIQTNQLEVHVNNLHENVQGKTVKVIEQLDEKIFGNRVDTYGGTQEKILQGESSTSIRESDTLTVQKRYSFTHHGSIKRIFERSSKRIIGRANLFRLGSVTSLSFITTLIYCGAHIRLSALRLTFYTVNFKTATSQLMNIAGFYEATGAKIERGFHFSYRTLFTNVNHQKLRLFINDGKTYQY